MNRCVASLHRADMDEYCLQAGTSLVTYALALTPPWLIAWSRDIAVSWLERAEYCRLAKDASGG
jgi:hypothetical protein